jgi:carboxypeptidase family protein
MALVSRQIKTYENQCIETLRKYKKKIFVDVAIVAVIMTLGYLFGAGIVILPKQGVGSIFVPIPIYQTGMGAINGHVTDISGLPAVGATIVAKEQGGSEKITMAIIPFDGKYTFQNLGPGKYIIVTAFPDGIQRVMNNINVDYGSIQTINFKY